MARDHIKLQIIIIIWGFTAVLGDLITLPAPVLVAWRTAMAAAILLIWLRRKVIIPAKDALIFTATGLVIGAHWVTFFLAVDMANVSICMVGLATLSLWTAILEPLMVRGRRFRQIDLIFGMIVLGGVAVIFRSELGYSHGFLVALLSAFLAAIFSVLNSFHIKKAGHLVITFYEMAGGFILALAYLVVSGHPVPAPAPLDWLWLTILSIFCTVIAFSAYVELLKRMSVFTINFANNLEPVYGILLAALILSDHEHLNTGFYTGASVILGAVLGYPIINQLTRRSHRESA